MLSMSSAVKTMRAGVCACVCMRVNTNTNGRNYIGHITQLSLPPVYCYALSPFP